MADKDVKYCVEQIQKKEAQIVDIHKKLDELKVQCDDYQELERYYKEERKTLMAKMQELNKALNRARCELGQMRAHKRELKKMKNFLAYQHEMIDNQRKKK